MKRKVVTGILVLSILISSLAGCGAAHTDTAAVAGSEAATDTEVSAAAQNSEAASEEAQVMDETAEKGNHANGTPWLNSCLIGNVTQDTPTDPKQDFHLFVNKDWILDTELPDGYYSWSNYSAVAEDTMEKAIKMLDGDDLPGHDAKLVQGMFDLYMDVDARNKVGYDPIKGSVEKILAAESLDDIKALYLEPDLKYEVENLMGVSVSTGISDADSYYVWISSPGLIMSDSANYLEENEYGTLLHDFNEELFIYMMNRLGMDRENALTCFQDAIELERKLAPHIYTDEESMRSDFMERVNNVMTLEEITELVNTYPLKEVLEANELGYDGEYIVTDPDYIRCLDGIFTEENATMLKNYILVKFVLNQSSALDEDTMQTVTKLLNQYYGSSGDMPLEEKAFSLVKSILPDSLSKEYIKMYSSEEDRQRVEDMCYRVIDTYHEILSGNDWATPETIAYALKKLDSMAVHVGWPDKWRDYSGLDIDGLSYYEALKKIGKYNMDLVINLLGTAPDKEMWADGLCVLECNAFYSNSDNSINMIVGMMGSPFYYSDMPVEELYASLGAFWIGHEISHAFDSNGSQYDLEGNLNNWWPEEDYAGFNERVKKMDQYLDGILIMDDYYANGSNIDSEMIADMTGLQCALKMAEKEENFDYAKFFEYYAKMNTSVSLYSVELSQIQGDPHPLDYQRTNVPVQQFDEFYKAFGVMESDGMYLAPEDRLIIW
ncbi:M13-type metalloendopeptidase [Eisenbergiella sp.]